MLNLEKRFKDAGLPLKMASAPMARGAPEVFGLNIVPDPKTKQRFEIWAGSDANRVEITSVDPKKKQLILFVQESERRFTTEVSKYQVPTLKDLKNRLSTRDRFVGETPSAWVVEQVTPTAKRHFLCGMDERGYFAAQLPQGVSTVKAAHNVLKSDSAKQARKKGPKIVRQGEFFFFKPTPTEVKTIEDGLKTKKLVVVRNLAIGVAIDPRGNRRQAGNPHTASEVIVIDHGPLREKGPTWERRKTAYVRGKVRHVEHATVEFLNWVRVERNAEVLSEGRSTGIAWVD
jgi:hypothetical protein